MLRKSLYLFSIVCLLLAVTMPASVALADRPEPLPPMSKFEPYVSELEEREPIPEPEEPPQPATTPGSLPSTLAKGVLIPNYDIPQVQEMPVTEGMRKAIALKESLTPTQQRAIRAVLDKYMPQLNLVASYLPAPGKAADVTKDLNQAAGQKAQDAANAQAVLGAIPRLKTVQVKIDEEIAAILTPEQWEEFQAGLSPAQKHLDAAGLLAKRAVASGMETPQFATDYCYYAGAYASIAELYIWYAYYYAYLNYTYGYGTYNSYYYLYTAEEYSARGLAELGGGYFDLITLGSDFNSFVYYGWEDEGYATNYAYYGYNYAYNDYAYNGSTYAYYAYVYGYYGNVYAYYAYVYGYSCYYG